MNGRTEAPLHSLAALLGAHAIENARAAVCRVSASRRIPFLEVDASEPEPDSVRAAPSRAELGLRLSLPRCQAQSRAEAPTLVILRLVPCHALDVFAPRHALSCL